MEVSVRAFYELTLDELYSILRIRNEVFIVEQNSVYLDVDGKDQDAIHMIFRENGDIVGILRILRPGTSFKEASIGRIISVVRGKGIGYLMMEHAIRYVTETLGEKEIRIEAQVQAMGFYERLGFVVDSDEFDDGGVMHREMIYRCKDL